MDAYFALKTLHVLGATILFGTGTGIAFFMLMAHRTRDAALVAHTAGVVVVADMIFTASAVILQPLTGAALAIRAGFPLFGGWIGLSLILYVVTGIFWLPVASSRSCRQGRLRSPPPFSPARLCGLLRSPTARQAQP
jgi:uncharacterized membrane protein